MPHQLYVRKTAKIRKRYNMGSNKNTINITNKSQVVSFFPAGDHKAAMNRRESMRNTQLVHILSATKYCC